MKITFLGTGTSSGVPIIGCDCPVCTSTDPRNRRRRTSLYVEAGGQCLLIDTPPDFREQALAYDVKRVDSVLFTHSHADHIFGFDDIRRFNTIQDGVIPAYASAGTIADLKRVFSYIGQEKVVGVYRPQIDFRELAAAITLGTLTVTPLPVEHGGLPTFGYRLDDGHASVGYIPDCHTMEESVIQQLNGCDVMILDALRHRPHSTHLTVARSLELLNRIQAKRSFLIHLCHDLDHAETQAALPEGVNVSYDGLTLAL